MKMRRDWMKSNLGKHVFSRLHLRMKMASAELNVISFKTITYLIVYKNNYKIISHLKLNASMIKKSLRKLQLFSIDPFSLQIYTNF